VSRDFAAVLLILALAAIAARGIALSFRAHVAAARAATDHAIANVASR
jgi:hypothetical protein